MMRRRYKCRYGSRPQQPKAIQIAIYNTARSAGVHLAFLQGCFAEDIDVMMITEPWISQEQPKTTQTHPCYDEYGPVDSWSVEEEDRPRVMIYVCKGVQLHTERRRPVHKRDMVWIDVNGYSLLNYYRDRETEEVLHYITSLEPPLPRGEVSGSR